MNEQFYFVVFTGDRANCITYASKMQTFEFEIGQFHRTFFEFVYTDCSTIPTVKFISIFLVTDRDRSVIRIMAKGHLIRKLQSSSYPR